jgi:two-component system, NarL family, nitrate/nitrite response regulator NarL
MLAHTFAPTGRPGSPPGAEHQSVAVVLASDLPLIAEAVAAALASLGLSVGVVTWPRGARAATILPALAEADADVGVLLYDVDMSIRMTEARVLLRSWSGPWLVLTGTPAGPAWGGLRVAGASLVASIDRPLAEVDAMIRRLASGVPVPDNAAIIDHVESWRALQARHGNLQQRLDSLAPRELEVLLLLSRGVRVRTIAHRLGLSEATVRTQVRAVLRKLGVRSQLAAVALLRAADRSAAAPDSR